MRMTDLEGHCGVVCLFLAHALIGEIGFVFYAGFPETLAQWNDADFAFVIGGIGEGLGFGFMGFAAVAGVEAVKCSGNGSIGQRLAIEEDTDFEAFADVDVGRVVQRYDSKCWPTCLVMMAVSALSWPTLTMFLPNIRVCSQELASGIS